VGTFVVYLMICENSLDLREVVTGFEGYRRIIGLEILKFSKFLPAALKRERHLVKREVIVLEVNLAIIRTFPCFELVRFTAMQLSLDYLTVPRIEKNLTILKILIKLTILRKN